jgi:hypothetical protein
MDVHEAPSGGDAPGLDKASPISLPGAHGGILGRHDRLDHRGDRFGPAEQRIQDAGIESVPAVHVLDECPHIGALRIGFRSGDGTGQDQQ